MIDSVSSTAELTARYQMAEKDYFENRLGPNKDFETAMTLLYMEIIKFYAKAARYFVRNTLARWLINVAKASDLVTAIKDIADADEKCRTFAINQYLSTLLNGQAEETRILLGIESAVNEKHLEEMLAWVSKTDIGAQHDFVRDKLGKDYFGTGKWLLTHNDFTAWISEPNGHFWLRGGIGTGKSSLVWIIIEHLRRKEENVAFFYCDATLQSLQTKHSPNITILRALTKQLSLSADGKSIAEEVKLKYESLKNPGPAGSQLGNSEVLDLLAQLIDSRDKIIIVVDALDECPQYLELLVLLQELSNSTAKLKFFFSSQLVVPFNDYFTATTINISAEEGQPNLNREDIQFFVEEENKKFEKIRKGVMTDDMRHEIIGMLPKKAGAM